MYISTKIYDKEANLASWVVRMESGLDENVSDTNNRES